jgi:hypothetical protein
MTLLQAALTFWLMLFGGWLAYTNLEYLITHFED